MSLRPSNRDGFGCRSAAIISLSLLSLGLVSAGIGCGGEVKTYQKKSAPTAKADIPPTPQLPNRAKKDGDTWTVYGLIHDLNSRVHRQEVAGKLVTVTGYIVRTNLNKCEPDDEKKALEGEGCVPECSLPKDPEKFTEAEKVCKQRVPQFVIADKPDEAREVIQVVGWATNFASLQNAILFDDMNDDQTCKEQKDCEKLKVPSKKGMAAPQCNNGMCYFMDQGSKLLPDPLPMVGAKVKVTGAYKVSVSMGSGLQPESNPRFGIIGPDDTGKLIIETTGPVEGLFKMPFMKERKPKKKKDEKK